MNQSDVKQVKRQLTGYNVPVGNLTLVGESSDVQVKNSQTAFELLIEQSDPDELRARETFSIILLNRAHRVLGVIPMFKGGLTGCTVDTRMILCSALLSLSSAIILAHNHPSGNTHPSDGDKSITKKIITAAQEMDINVLDHVIYTHDGRYYSMADEGVLQ